MAFDAFLDMNSDSKNYVRLQDDEIFKLGHTIKSARACLCVHQQLEIFIELRQRPSFKPNKKMKCFSRIAKRF